MENEFDMPIGFGMMLEGDPAAKENYHRLTGEEKQRLINYMQQAKSGDDSEYRVANAFKVLKESEKESFY